jgi:hypothetical protein
MGCSSGFGSSIGDIVGGLIGNAILPGAGAIIGAGLGGAAGSAATGGNLKQDLTSGLIGGASAGIGGALTGAFPETMGAIGLPGNPLSAAGSALGLTSVADNAAPGVVGAGDLAGSTPDVTIGPLGAASSDPGLNAGNAGINVDGASYGGTASPALGASSAAGASPGGIAGLLSNIPVVGGPLSTAASQVGNMITNHLPLTALGAAMLYNSYKNGQTQQAAQKAAQQQAAAIAQQQAQGNNAVNAIIKQSPMTRTMNPANANINYSTYGQGPEQSFYSNLNPLYTSNIIGSPSSTYSQPLKRGGAVRRMAGGGSIGDGEPDMDAPGLPRHLVEKYSRPIAIPRGDDGEPDMDAPGLPRSKGVPDSGPQYKAAGGMMKRGGKPTVLRDGPGTVNEKPASGGQKDDVPARLSEGEFVMPADVVAHLGDGNTAAGSAALHSLIAHVRKHKTSNGTGLPPAAKKPNAYIGGGK